MLSEDVMPGIRPALTVLFVLFPVLALGDDYEVLRHFKTVLWPQAYRTQDVELLDKLLHDSFEMIDGEGNRSTKAEELHSVANNQWDPGTFEYRIERLQVYQGSFAVIAGTGIAERYTYKSSNFLVKEDGVWRAIASHVSPRASRTLPGTGTRRARRAANDMGCSFPRAACLGSAAGMHWRRGNGRAHHSP